MNVTVDVKKPAPSKGKSAIGVDLGLKDFSNISDGKVVAAQRFYRDLAPALAVSQRASKKHRTQAIHAKIANRRKDFLHKLSTQLVKNHGAILVGNVNACGLAKTKMAKSVLDASWSTFRAMLQYKGDDAGCIVRVTNEAFSTQTCSCCKARTGPKGLAELNIRNWICGGCSTEHDRDINAAKNILARGLVELAEEFSSAAKAKACGTALNKDSGAFSTMAEAGHGLPVVGILAL